MQTPARSTPRSFGGGRHEVPDHLAAVGKPMILKPILLTEAEAAEALRLCRRTLRKARADGQLRYILVGRAVRYTPDDLQSWIDSLRQAAQQCLQPSPRSTTPQRRPRSGGQIVPFHQRKAGARGRERL